MAKEIFIRADADGSNCLSRNEIKKIFRELHMKVNNKSMKEMFEKYDFNKNG